MSLKGIVLLIVWVFGWFALTYSDHGSLKEALGAAGGAAIFAVFIMIFFGDEEW